MIWLLSVLQKSFLGRFFTSYDRANDRYERLTARKHRPSRRTFAKMTENNRVLNAFPRMFEYLMRVSLRDYGILMFMTGAVVAILYPMNDKILFVDITFEMFVFGTATSVCSIPLLFSSRSLAENVLDSGLFSSVLFDFLGFDQDSFRLASEKGVKKITTFAFLIGAGLGVGSYFVLPVYTILILLAIALAYSVIRTPEIGVVVSVFIIPFASINIVGGVVMFTFICYVFKVMLGKRIFKFEYFDFWVSATIIVLTVCGINYSSPMSSLRQVITNLVIMLSYFMISNLIHSKEWFKRCIVAFTTSSLIVAIIAILQVVLSKISEAFEVLQMVFPTDAEASSTLGDRNSLAQFLVVAIPFALVHMVSEKKEITKFAGFLLSAVLVSALVLTGTGSAILGLIVGALLLFAFYNRKSIYLLVLLCVALPVLYFTLPDGIIGQIVSVGPLKGYSIREELLYIKEGFLVAIERPFGIGLGEKTMQGILPQYKNGYIDSLPIQLLATFGVIGVAVLAVTIIMYSRLMLSYATKAKNQYRRVNCCAGLCSVMGLLTSGIFDYVLQDKRIFLILVVTIALSFAYIKMDREEESGMKSYVGISRASLEIPLKEEMIREAKPRRRYVHISKIKKGNKEKQETEEDEEVKEFSSVLREMRLEPSSKEENNGEGEE